MAPGWTHLLVGLVAVSNFDATLDEAHHVLVLWWGETKRTESEAGNCRLEGHTRLWALTAFHPVPRYMTDEAGVVSGHPEQAATTSFPDRQMDRQTQSQRRAPLGRRTMPDKEGCSFLEH